MTESIPVVYLLHGDDEFAIAQFVAGVEAKLGDPAMAVMNTSRLDGRSFNMDNLLSIAAAMPFMTKRRLVIVEHPLAQLNSPTSRENFKVQLEKVPVTTALVLIEYKLLSDPRKKPHWLERWAKENSGRVFSRAFLLPKGAALGRWIQDQARKAGGAFTPQAASLLATLVSEDPRLVDQEIQKLLTYVDYRRPVEPDDVQNLTADYRQGDIFAMVDALGNQDGKQALWMLHRLLEESEPYSIFGMIVRQFRLLLLTRELIDCGSSKEEVMRRLKLHPYVADKMLGQARRFDIPTLEGIYHRLLDVDEVMKTSQMSGALALDTLVTALTSSPHPN